MMRARIDPRSQRERQETVPGAARRPRFDLARKALPASGRPRRDPRMEIAHSRVPGGLRPRFDRSNRPAMKSGHPVAETAPAHSSTHAEPAIRTIAEPAFLVFAFVEAPGGRLTRFDRQILGGAHLLAGAGDGGGAVVALSAGPVAGIGEAGADRVLILGEDASPNRRGRMIAAHIRALSPRHVLLAEDGESADLARRLCVELGEGLVDSIEHLTARQVVRPLGGNRRESAGAPPRLMTLREGRAKPYGAEPCEARALDGGETPGPCQDDDSAILSIEIIAGDPSMLALSESDFVVSAGHGVHDFETFRTLAARLQATPGASRMVCDAGLMPRQAQVGASGTVLGADCYFALGISGAPQHLQGVAACEHVIAVNTDLHAAMIERAGLAIVQDAQAVMTALLDLLEEKRA